MKISYNYYKDSILCEEIGLVLLQFLTINICILFYVYPRFLYLLSQFILETIEIILTWLIGVKTHLAEEHLPFLPSPRPPPPLPPSPLHTHKLRLKGDIVVYRIEWSPERLIWGSQFLSPELASLSAPHLLSLTVLSVSGPDLIKYPSLETSLWTEG